MNYDFAELTIKQIHSVFENMGYQNALHPKADESEFVAALRSELKKKIFVTIDEARK